MGRNVPKSPTDPLNSSHTLLHRKFSFTCSRIPTSSALDVLKPLPSSAIARKTLKVRSDGSPFGPKHVKSPDQRGLHADESKLNSHNKNTHCENNLSTFPRPPLQASTWNFVKMQHPRHVSAPISGNQFHDLFMWRGKVREAVTIKTKLLYNNFEILEPQPHRTYADKKGEGKCTERATNLHSGKFNCQTRENEIDAPLQLQLPSACALERTWFSTTRFGDSVFDLVLERKELTHS